MKEIEYIQKHREQSVDNCAKVLNKSSEMMALLNVFGRLDSEYYTGLLINMCNMNERFLETGDSSTIDYLYDIYRAAKENSSLENAYKILKTEMVENLPAYQIEESKMRRKRYHLRNLVNHYSKNG